MKDAPNPAAARLLIRFLMGDDSPDGGPGYEPFFVPGDYAARENIELYPDSLSLEQLGAWSIDPDRLLQRRQETADLLLTLE